MSYKNRLNTLDDLEYHKLSEIKEFDKSCTEKMARLGCVYAEQFYVYANNDKKALQKYLSITSSELEKLLSISEATINRDLLDCLSQETTRKRGPVNSK